MLNAMTRPLRLLLVEDSPNDSALLLRHLQREGLTVESRRVETRPEMIAALQEGAWDLVVSDYGLPRFSGLEAIATAIAFDPDLPVILVSGTVGEETAAEVMRAGARDFMLKGSLARLGMAMQRELKAAQLRRSQRREAQVMLQTQAIARAGGWEWNREGNDLFCTEGAVRLMEAPAGTQFTVQSASQCLMAGELAKVEAQLHSTREVIDLDVRVTTRTGQPLTLRLVGRAERKDGTLERLVGAILDVSEHRQLEESLRLNDRLISMGTIAAGVAHEINNPLTHLVASLPLVLEAVKKQPGVDAEVSELIEGCIEGAQRITTIVRDLKVFSRPDESEASSDVNAVLSSVLNLLNLEYRHKTRIQREVAAGLHVAAPAARLAQVLTNLIINAVQAMPARPADQNLIKVLATVDQSMITLKVADNGQGMSEAVKARLFSPFFTTKPVGEGTGLGLSVCRSIVSAVGGSIEVESEEGAGTTFTVRLPLARQAVSVEPPARVEEPRSRALRVLMVDDEPFLRRVTQRLMRPHQVIEAGSADEGLSILAKDQAFDVILCDLMMPGLSGKDFYREMSARSPQLASRFLFVSGGAVTAETQAFLDEVAPDRVVLKPFTSVQLRSAVERLAAQELPG